MLEKLQELRDSTTAVTQKEQENTSSQKGSTNYSEIEINPTVVRMIGQVWFSRSSMLVSGESGELSFAKGALVKEKPANCLKDVLTDDFVSLQPSEFSGGSWLVLKTTQTIATSSSSGIVFVEQVISCLSTYL